MEVRKGTYVLFMCFSDAFETDVGSLGKIRFPKGNYCYVGSAMAGLDQRLERHLSLDKKTKWHVDYISVKSGKSFAYESSGDFVEECELGKILENVGGKPFAKGFGSSDCGCFSHLYRVPKGKAVSALKKHGLKKYVPVSDRARRKNKS